jgi:tetratricopeptide (TPR) repeat protein
MASSWDEAKSRYERAVQLESERAFDRAFAEFQAALALNPHHARSLERVGMLTYAGRGTAQSYEQAADFLKRSVALDPSLCDATMFLAMSLGRLGREEQSRLLYERAIALSTDPALAMAVYADGLADLGHFDEAENLFKAAVERDPCSILALRDYGRTLIRSHNPGADRNLEAAIQLFRKALALDEADAESHYRLSNALAADGQIQQGQHHLQRAVELDPSHVRARDNVREIEQSSRQEQP